MNSVDLLSDYVRVPNVTVSLCVAMATELLTLVPEERDSAVEKAVVRLRTSLEALHGHWGARGAEAEPEVSAKSADQRTDCAWGALHSRLQAWTWLPAEHPEPAQATQILRRLFPSGLTFLTLQYRAQWAEGDKRLRQIDQEQLGEQIDALVGPAFLAEVRVAQKLYGEALGIISPLPDAPSPVSLAGPLQELRRAIRHYALQVIARVDDNQPNSVEEALRILSPIASAREKRGAGAPTESPSPNGTPNVPSTSTPAPGTNDGPHIENYEPFE